MKSNLQIVIQGREISIPIQLTTDQLNEIAMAMQSDERLTGWEKPEDTAGHWPIYFLVLKASVPHTLTCIRITCNSHFKKQQKKKRKEK